METLDKRQAQITYAADLWVLAFYASRGIPDVVETDGTHRQTAVMAGARIALTDDSGADLDSIRTIAEATLAAQDFRLQARVLFTDDLRHASAVLAREMRQAEQS